MHASRIPEFVQPAQPCPEFGTTSAPVTSNRSTAQKEPGDMISAVRNFVQDLGLVK